MLLSDQTTITKYIATNNKSITTCLVPCSENDGEPSSMKPKMDDDLDGGLENLVKAKVTEVIIF